MASSALARMAATASRAFSLAALSRASAAASLNCKRLSSIFWSMAMALVPSSSVMASLTACILSATFSSASRSRARSDAAKAVAMVSAA